MGNSICPACGATFNSRGGGSATCMACGRGSDVDFQAVGEEAMPTQAQIVNYHNKMITLRAFAPYVASVLFAVIAAALIVFAPESRTAAANIVAGALLILATGLAGFTRLKAKAPGVDIDTGRGNSN